MRYMLCLLVLFILPVSLGYAQVSARYHCSSNNITVAPSFEVTDYPLGKSAFKAWSRKMAKQGLLVGVGRNGTLNGQCRVGANDVSFTIPYDDNASLDDVSADGTISHIGSNSMCDNLQFGSLELSVNGAPWLKFKGFSHHCIGSQFYQMRLWPEISRLDLCVQQPGGFFLDGGPADSRSDPKYTNQKQGTYTPTIRCRTIFLNKPDSPKLPLRDEVFQTHLGFSPSN